MIQIRVDGNGIQLIYNRDIGRFIGKEHEIVIAHINLMTYDVTLPCAVFLVGFAFTGRLVERQNTEITNDVIFRASIIRRFLKSYPSYRNICSFHVTRVGESLINARREKP